MREKTEVVRKKKDKRKKYLRKTFYIKKAYQRAVLVKFMTAIAAGIVIKNLVLYFYIEKILGSAMKSSVELSAHVIFAPLIKANIVVATTGLVVFMFLLLKSNYKLGINMSRLSGALRRAGSGDLSVRIEGLNCLLLGDYTKIFNTAMDTYQKKASGIGGSISKVEGMLEKGGQSKGLPIEEMLEEIGRVESALEGLSFKAEDEQTQDQPGDLPS